MARRNHRTDTTLFLVVIAILSGGFFWAANRAKPATTANPTGNQTNSTTASSNPTAQSVAQKVVWTGELILTRGNQVIGRRSNGTQRIIYSTPSGVSLVATSGLADSHILIQLSSGNPTVLDLALATGGTTARTDLTSLALVAPRPTTSGIAQATFSNAERDFGTSINLIEKGVSRSIYKTPQTVTALAWRTDGDALAIGTQTGVVIINLTSGDSVPSDLATPVRSLNWSGSTVIAVTAKDAAVQITPGENPSTKSLSDGFGAIGRDFMVVNDDRFVWLQGSSQESDLLGTAEPSVNFQKNTAKPIKLAEASHILGVIND